MNLTWRISSFSNNGSCVEVAVMPDRRTAVRNSNHREAGAIIFTPAEMAAFLQGVKAGEFDDLARLDG